MATPMTSTAWGDVLDRRMTRIFDKTTKELSEMGSKLYSMPGTRKGPDERFSNAGEMGDLQLFDGTVTYTSSNQGYDVVATHLEWALGTQITRKLWDDDLFAIIDKQPARLARSGVRTKETHRARVFTMAFSNDTLFYTHSEGVALCSNSHTTTSGASTATGFDNLGTAALSATAVASARIQMRGFRGDVGQRINVMPDEIWIPPNLYETAYEIVSSMGKVDVADNNANVHQGQYTIYEWNYMSDANDWFMCDSSLREDNLMWFDRIPVEFGNTEDFDTFVRKYRVYTRYSYLWNDWRWVMGHQVS